MSEPTFSPDGKWMWNGSEWIPAPPKSPDPSTNVNLHDSVIGGDVNITHNEVNPAAIGEGFKKAMMSMKNEEMNNKRLQELRDNTILEHSHITHLDYEELVYKLSNLWPLKNPILNIHHNNHCMIQILKGDRNDLPWSYMINIALEGTNLSPVCLNHLNVRINTEFNTLEKYFARNHKSINELISDLYKIHEIMGLSDSAGRLSASYF